VRILQVVSVERITAEGWPELPAPRWHGCAHTGTDITLNLNPAGMSCQELVYKLLLTKSCCGPH